MSPSSRSQTAIAAPYDDNPIPALKPPLKWAGGKRWLVPHLQPLWHAYCDRMQLSGGSPRLVEPFVGGMAVALGLRPQRALLNDTNQSLIEFYRWLQKGLQRQHVFDNDKELYYRYRDRFNALLAAGRGDSAAAAELFYYLNRTGFNGLCRFNRRNQFNVPFGRYKTIPYATSEAFSAYREVLHPWRLSHGDFADLPLDSGDFIYADPPYDVEFTSYSAGGFDWSEQVRLADWLARYEGPVVASNQATDRILDLYRDRGFEIRLLSAPRRISCTGDRTPAQEMLAIGPMFDGLTRPVSLRPCHRQASVPRWRSPE